jgi:hypothetical protein
MHAEEQLGKLKLMREKCKPEGGSEKSDTQGEARDEHPQKGSQ